MKNSILKILFGVKRRFIFLLFLLLFFSCFNSFSSMIYPGEDLLYEVSFFGVKLGTIHIITEDNQTIQNQTTCKAIAYIDSYKGIPFVDLHTIFESWFDPSVTFSYKFNGHTKENDYWLFDQFYFNYPKNQIEIEKWKLKQKYYGKIFKSKRKWNDGLSLFFFARQFTKSGKSVRVPTFIDRDTTATIINFTGKRENVEISAVDYPIRTVYFDGQTEWTGVYGMTGSFEGWFSDDDASVPIQAKMKVYIGSVKLQLIKWHRGNWVPPKG